MPTLDALGLIAAYIALAVILLGMLLYSNWHWLLKAAAIMMLSLFYYVSYFSYPSLMGWPTSRDLPKRFHLIAIFVDAPRKIYFWGSDLKHGADVSVPRSFELPYSKALHAKMEEAGHKLKKGFPIIGEFQASPSKGLVGGAGQSETKANIKLEFMDVPADFVPNAK